MIYKYSFVDADGNILTVGDDNAVVFGGLWSVKDSNGYPKWLENNIYCYYNNGFDYKMVTSIYTAQTGEVLFTSLPTEAQLIVVFSGRAAAIKAQKITELSATYQTKYNNLALQYGKIDFSDGDTIETKRAAAKALYKSYMAAYTTEKAAILNG